MRRTIHNQASWLMAVLATTVAVSCTLDITAPIEPPPETWDPALNTHPDSLMFQELLKRHVREGLPGVVLMVRTSEGQWNGSAGYAKIETAVRMLPTHRHFAASVTKMYTATAVLLLAEDGLIDLDARISKYLPATIYGRIPNGAVATVRQLLGHTSGIPDFGDDLGYQLDTLNDPMGWYPPERLISYVDGLSAYCTPGASYFYSNTNYLLLALMMDHATGASHANVISERILQPLDLGATYYKNEPGYPKPPGLVNSYQDLAGDGRLMNISDMTVHYTGMFIGNTGLIASSADYAAFIEALLDGSLISQASLAEMQDRTKCSCYGLGLSFIETPYGPGLGHNGSDFGILSEVRHFPDVDATLVLLVNGGDSGVTERLFRHLWDEAMRTALDDL
ncbi:MAG: beta-lactamase family protein [candidate division WOR-3 bacterium]|nr:MAG: beta-lactamase family protein [candidate division WOR-3 bacterium]UCF04967.1 MAG: beta-lactamase family protein [bacterium]